MEPRNSPSFSWMSNSLHRIIGLGFGSGLSPIAPGTAGTLLGWVLFSIGYAALPNAVLAIAITLGSFYGLWVCGRCSKDLHRPDDGAIVWDEIIAFCWILFILSPASFATQVITFLIFRFFDAVKPWPINRIDAYFKTNGVDRVNPSQSEVIRQGFGIMIDDLLAALFTIVIMLVGLHWMT
jgi:phosphatidylglycerophosphatase A